MGKAALVGSMSVPQGWTEAAPAIRTLAQVLPTNLAAAPAASLAGEGGVFSQMGLSSLAGRAVAASATHSVRRQCAAAGSLGGVVAEADPADGHHHRDTGPRGLTAMDTTHSSPTQTTQARATR